MNTLAAGDKAPTFELPSMDGASFSLEELLSRGPVLAVFFKISCPVCQYALPYYDRLYNAYGREKLTIIGISQNEKPDTADFIRKFGITFPVLLDDTKTFAASNAYGLTTVPSTFWIAPDGQIEIASVSWARKEFETIAARAASTVESAPAPIFQPGEKIADFRAG
jgi:peroxiredoxin